MRKAVSIAGIVAVAVYGLGGIAHAADDKYQNYAELAQHEKEGQDYRRTLRAPGEPKVAHIAIHGGAIEPGTTQLADRAAASHSGYAYYSFEGIKPSGNGDLHITSTRFDEPRGLALAQRVDYTVSWHGAGGSTPLTYVGGLDAELREQVACRLGKAGFAIAPTSPDDIDGNNPRNIANRNRRHKGVQLELSTAQRKAFFTDGRLDRAWIEDPAHRTEAFEKYIKAVDQALSNGDC
ncbi:poly-gamma-glutamate hydrolase family protein [Actinomadura terrae]|uniref:poly-gamma-glutamate hydrolase family protein n=1 Tax=Actinomadura terrae TaxID=604353 RepID=UPI001FA78F3D|nr:poly-gamma-glutamate hydrolase family protein [Actinomadura terrae]